MNPIVKLVFLWVPLLVAGLIMGGGCRKRKPQAPPEGGQPATEAADSSAGAGSATAEGVVSARQTFTAPPAGYVPPSPALRWSGPQPANMYAPALPGDYQAQLNEYNKALRRWAEDTDTPRTFEELMANISSPKPPQPPPGRSLVYDQKTVTVRLR